MFRRSRRRFTIVLLLALALWPTWPAAASAGEAGPAWSRAFQPLDLVLRLWTALTGLWGENGCSLDPSGTCGGGVGGGATTTSDAGCMVDPSGTCGGAGGTETTSGDHGCSPDPNGGCGH